MLNLKKLSIKSLLFTSYFSFVLIIVFIFIIVTFTGIDNLFQSKTDSEMNIQLNASNNSLEYIINENIALSTNICNDDELKYQLRNFANLSTLDQLQAEQKISQIFDGYWRGRSEISQINVFTNGKKYTATGINAVHRLEDIENNRIISPYLSLRSALITDYGFPMRTSADNPNTNKMVLITKILDYNKTLLGYVFVEIDKQSLFNQFITDTSPNSFVVDNTGKYVLSFDSKLNTTNITNADLKEAISTDKSGKKLINYNGAKSTVFFSATNDQGWKTVSIKQNAIIYTWRGLLISFFVSFALVSILIAWVFLKQVSKQLIMPIIQLSNSMNKFEKIYNTNIYSSEINVLYEQYNLLLKKQDEMLIESKLQNEEQRNAEIRSLIAQINPHFLYNTLNSIGWSAISANVPHIVSMISKLSKICYINYDLSSMITTLSKELIHVNLYMDLQKECFHNKFKYEITMDDEALSNCIVPKFILQPIVENSIIHGFSQISHDGKIHIQFFKTDTLNIRIKDNGIGISEDIVNKLNFHEYRSEKYGIYNINERIKLICGNEYGVFYESNSHSGTLVTITLPLTLNTEDLGKDGPEV